MRLREGGKETVRRWWALYPERAKGRGGYRLSKSGWKIIDIALPQPGPVFRLQQRAREWEAQFQL